MSKILESICMFVTSDNEYCVFNQYIITNKGKVTKISSGDEIQFTCARVALTWVIFEYRNLLNKSLHLHTLDKELGFKFTEIRILEKQRESLTIDKDSTDAKLSEAITKYNIIENAIDTYVNEAKFWQETKFASAVTITNKIFLLNTIKEHL